jgi:hypothetical protein
MHRSTCSFSLDYAMVNLTVKRSVWLMVLLLIAGCQREEVETVTYVDLEAQVRRITLEGYDGYIITDWEITNPTAQEVSGWEVEVRVVTVSNQTEEGLFFNHEAPLAPGESRLFVDNILFHLDADNMYPVTLKYDDHGIRSWQVLQVRGLVQ